MPLADVELIVARRVDGTTVSMRVELPSHRVEPVRGVPITLTDAVLTALTLSPNVYSAALTAMVFPPALREAWREACGYADGRDEPLRVRLTLDGDDTLHALRWELLRDPINNMPLAYSERVRLSRFLPTASYRPLHLASRPELRAVVAVASPPWLPEELHAVDVADEVARAQQGLGNIPAIVLNGRDGQPTATLPAIAAALREGAHILYLVCHGTLVDGRPYLWLEQEGDTNYQPVAGDALVQQIIHLQRRPLLIVLASCQSAGDNYHMLAAIGPKLAQAGVGAVIAMQGNVPKDLVAQLTPSLFTELRRDGQIDRALAAARAALPAESPWWMPALWMTVRDGALWHKGSPRELPKAMPDPEVGQRVPAPQLPPSTPNSPDPKTDIPVVSLRVLRDKIIQSFNLDELALLCMDIEEEMRDSGVHEALNLELVGGDSKAIKVLNLISYLERRSLLAYLVAAVQRARPGLL